MLSMRQSNQDVDDDAPTLEFALPLVRPIAVPKVTHQRDGLWDANDVAGYLKVSRSWVYHRAEGGQLPTTLVDIQGAADYLDVSIRTVRRMVARHEVPYRRVGKVLRFDLTDLRPPRVG
jgi:excisionase family DNA binding protein